MSGARVCISKCFGLKRGISEEAAYYYCWISFKFNFLVKLLGIFVKNLVLLIELLSFLQPT